LGAENFPDRTRLLALAVEIVSAYTENNALEMAAVPDMIGSVFAKLSDLAAGEQALPEALTPAVPIRRSVTEDHIVCLEDGKKLKTLKRHLMVAHGLTPEDYRARWGLKRDYPMIAPAYETKRQEIAKDIGLGRKLPIVEPAPEPAIVPATPPKKRGRNKSAA
jgi:predicted transcriptional regulator